MSVCQSLPVCFLGRVLAGSFERDLRRALAYRVSKSLASGARPLLPDSNSLLNIGRRSPRTDIASAGWKWL